MKKLSLLAVLFLVAASTLFTSCKKDEDKLDTILVLESGSSDNGAFVTSAVTVAPGELFDVKLEARKGDDLMDFLQVKVNNSTFADINNYYGLGDSELKKNDGYYYFELHGEDRSEVSVTLELRAPATANIYTYTFVVKDLDGTEIEQAITVTVESTQNDEVVEEEEEKVEIKEEVVEAK